MRRLAVAAQRDVARALGQVKALLVIGVPEIVKHGGPSHALYQCFGIGSGKDRVIVEDQRKASSPDRLFQCLRWLQSKTCNLLVRDNRVITTKTGTGIGCAKRIENGLRHGAAQIVRGRLALEGDAEQDAFMKKMTDELKLN